VTAPSGRTADGHWSVDEAGSLHLRIGDAPDSRCRAWVANGTLSIADKGETTTLHRVPAS